VVLRSVLPEVVQHRLVEQVELLPVLVAEEAEDGMTDDVVVTVELVRQPHELVGHLLARYLAPPAVPEPRLGNDHRPMPDPGFGQQAVDLPVI